MDAMQRIVEQMAEMDGRIRTLEGGQRSGLSSTVTDAGSAGFEITSFGVSNWSDDAAGGVTPEVTITTGQRALVFAAWRPLYVGVPGTSVGVNDYRTTQAVMGIGVNGVDANLLFAPPMMSQFVWAGPAGGYLWAPFTVTAFREDLTPGPNTFTMQFYAIDSNPSGTVNPLATDTFLVVIPLGFD